MANKNKGAKPAAPKTNKQTVENANIVENPKDTTVQVIDMNKFTDAVTKKPAGLDANHQVDMLMGLKAYFHDDPNAADKFGKDSVDRVNKRTESGFVTACVQECYYGGSSFAATMRASQVEDLKELAPVIGFTIDSKLLPAPDKNGNITVPGSAIKVSNDTKKKIDAEKKASEKPIIDPTKIETNDQLKASLTFMLSDNSVSKRYFDRITRTTEFLRAYQSVVANKAGGNDKDANLEKIKAKTTPELLEEVRVLVGEVPFSSVGLSHFVYSKLCAYKNPIFSFCLVRNASKNNGVAIDDNLTAGIVRTLVNWANGPKLDGYLKDLERAKSELKKGTKKQDYVDAIQHNVDICTSYAEQVSNCPTDFADNLLENLKSEDIAVSKAASDTVTQILKTYFSMESLEEAGDDKEQILHDVQQRAGIITNLFRDPLSQDVRYSEANLTYSPKTETTEKN